MKKTFLEWSVADKKAQWVKELLRIPVKWVPDSPVYYHIGPNISKTNFE